MAVTIALVLWMRGDTPRAPEPVAFAEVQPELFGVGGTLTDAWADFDGDGDPDRFVGFNGEASRLYRNDGLGGFVDVASSVGLAVERRVRTSAWGDFDADGDPDLLLGYAGDSPVTALYRNDGADGFMDVAPNAGLELSEGTTRQASWVDYDGDGDLDLFLGMRDRANLLFRNDGSGDGGPTFTDVTEASGIGDTRRTVGAVWADFDQDGDMDVLVGNMDGDANGLFLQEEGLFTDAAGGTPVAGGGRGLGNEALGTVRPCAVDYDGDGRLDLFFANYGPNELLRSTADGGWEAVGDALGLAVDARFDSCIWGDFDHDGTEDLFVNGTVTGGVQYPDYLFRREGAESFVNVLPPELAGLALDHGATWVDYDQDGDLDLSVIGVPDDGVHFVMQNLLRPEFAGHSLQVRVLDQNGAATRNGAEVRLFAAGTDDLLGMRLIDTGSGYDSQSDLPVHFGLPGAQPVDVEVTVMLDGERRTGRLPAVDPDDYRNGVLTVRVGQNGEIMR
jgi:FG-GAP-like repeat/ASPIC and UnbV